MIFNVNNSEVMRMDSDGNVGVGTSSPNSALEVMGSVGDVILVRTSGENGLALKTVTSGIPNIQGTNSALTAVSNISINAEGGDVGIGTPNPLSIFHVAEGGPYSRIDAGDVVFYNGSSRQLKDNIEYIIFKDASSRLSNLKPATYNWKIFDSEGNQIGIKEEKKYGMIAEDVKVVYPTMNEGEINWNIILTEMLATVINITNKIEILENRILELEKTE